MAPRLVSGACWVFGSTILDFTFSVICIVLMLARVVRPPAVVVSAEEKAGPIDGDATNNRGPAPAPGFSIFSSGGKDISPPGLESPASLREGQMFSARGPL